MSSFRPAGNLRGAHGDRDNSHGFRHPCIYHSVCEPCPYASAFSGRPDKRIAALINLSVAVVEYLVSRLVPCLAVVGCIGLAESENDCARGVSTVYGVDKYELIYGLDIKSSLAPRLAGCGVKNFRFVNDASAFALGECIGGAARQADRVLALTLGTGVGSGFVAGRRLVESGDDVPANGWVYCLPFEDTIVDDSFSTRWICRRYKELAGEDVSGAKDVAERYGNCDAARRLFDEYGERLARFAVPVVERFRADALVLGGNISRAYPLLGEPMKAVMDAMGCNVKVMVSFLMDKAALTGAASLFA